MKQEPHGSRGPAGERRTAVHARPRAENPFRIRKPFALKLVVALVLVTVGASLWQGLRDYSISRRRLDDLKNQFGVGFVRQLALFIRPFWATVDAKGTVGETDSDTMRAGELEVETKLKEYARYDAGKEILDVVVFAADRPSTFYASLGGQGSFEWSQGPALDVPFAAQAEVTIVEGERDGKAVRSFTTPVRLGGQAVGNIVLYLSAEDLQAAAERLWGEVARNVTLGALLAIGVSILMGTLLTRPIRILAQDMHAVTAGNLDYRSAVRSADEVGDLARTFNSMIESLKESQERRAAQKAMEKELGIARFIQKGLLPETLPLLRTWEVAARWVPAKEVGGDYYDFIDLGGGAWGVAVADVSGKGIPASLIMSMTRCLLRLASRAGQGPSGTLALVDEVLAPDLKGGMFVSMVYLRISEGSGDVRLVRAGHNPPILVHAKDPRPELCQTPGVALGVRSGFGHQASPEAALALEPGDVLVLYSDGIVEAMNDQQKEYGTPRLAQVIASSIALSAENLAGRIMADVAEWRGKAGQSDDITLVVLKRKSQ
jgi:serine phosphatase RsbU (regulator of sigma subunit)